MPLDKSDPIVKAASGPGSSKLNTLVKPQETWQSPKNVSTA